MLCRLPGTRFNDFVEGLHVNRQILINFLRAIIPSENICGFDVRRGNPDENYLYFFFLAPLSMDTFVYDIKYAIIIIMIIIIM